jgi:hypothetical protein
MFFSPFSEEVADLISRDRVTCAVAVKVDFASGTVYAHSGTGPIVMGGYVYHGVGTLGSIDSVSESHTTSPTQFKMTLSGLDQSLLATTLNDSCVGRSAEIYLLVLDDAGKVQANNLLFKGRISSPTARVGEKNMLQYTLSNVFEDWQRPWTGRFTDESHKAEYSDDRIFRYVSQMAERSIYWGSKKDAPGFTYS